MPKAARKKAQPMSDKTNSQTGKENISRSATGGQRLLSGRQAQPIENREEKKGAGSQRQLSGRQIQPTEKLAQNREEKKAAAVRRDAAKVRKTRNAQGNGDEDDDQLGDEAEPEPLTTFKTHTVASKTVSLKTKAIANLKRTHEYAPTDEDAPNISFKSQPVTKAKRDHQSAQIHVARPVEDAPNDHTMDDNGLEEDGPEEDGLDEEDADEDDGDEDALGEDVLDDDAPDNDEDEQMVYENRGRSPELDESRSGGDVCGLKRRPSSSDSLKETKLRRTSSGRPKAADYDESAKALIILAISYYRANISSLRAFPDIATEATMVSEVWKFACWKFDTTAAITPQIAKIVKSITLSESFLHLHYWQITSRGSQLRGELKSKTRPLVEGYFGFESGLNRKIISKNRETAENLKDGKGFVYKIPDANHTERKGLYQAKIIQKVVNAMWFRNKQDEGVIHEENFSPLSIEAVALVLAAIECCIDEWISGIRTDIPFSAALYKDVYEDHIRCLERFDKVTKQIILPNILLKLYNRGRFHAGASPISTASAPTIPDEAFHAALKEYEDDPKTESDGENGDSD